MGEIKTKLVFTTLSLQTFQIQHRNSQTNKILNATEQLNKSYTCNIGMTPVIEDRKPDILHRFLIIYTKYLFVVNLQTVGNIHQFKITETFNFSKILKSDFPYKITCHDPKLRYPEGMTTLASEESQSYSAEWVLEV